MKKILFVITGLDKWGAQRQLFNLINWIKNDFQIEVVCFFDGYYKKELENIWIQVHLISIKSTFWFFKATYETNKIVKIFNPNVIQSMLPHANIVSKFVNMINYKKYTIYTWVRNSQEPKLLGILEKITNIFCTKIITNSYTNRQELIKRWFSRDKIQVIYNGIAFEKPKRKYTYDKKTILTVAKFYDQKDYETNVGVVEKLSTIRTDFQFLYVWEWPDREKIEKLVKEKWLEEYIKFLWVRNDIPELMNSADVFFLPTKFEGQANVLLEAMYYGLPIVTTNIPENTEICKGILWEVWDVDFFADQIDQYLDNKIDFTEKVSINKGKIKQFSVENMTDQYLEVYDK